MPKIGIREGLLITDVVPLIPCHPREQSDKLILPRQGEPPKPDVVDTVTGIGRALLGPQQMVEREQPEQQRHDSAGYKQESDEGDQHGHRQCPR